MQRLTVEDRLMLWPDAIWPQEHGALAVLDGGALDGRVRVEDVRHMIEGRLHLVPRLRQVLVVPRRGLGGPLWVDASAFDLGDHIRVFPLPAPGDEAVLLRTVEQLRRRRLDRSRPLWEMWFLTGLPDRRVALFVRMHHAIADGVAAMATIGAFLDTVPDATGAPAQPWTPAPPPTARALLADNLRQHLDGVARALATLARPVTTVRRMRSAWPALRGLVDQPRTPATSLNRRVGADRVLALVRTTLNEVTAIAHRHDATVNDVLLGATAGGLRALLRERGEPVDGVTMRISVPITLRQGSRAQARGNLISQMIIPLPLGVPDPGQRLRLIAAETSRHKAEPHPPLGTVLRTPLARWALLKALDRQPVNVTSADLPGPRQPLYLAGAPVLEVFPLLPLIGTVCLGVGALSYAEQFTVMAVADRDICPDLEVFVAGFRDDLAALGAATVAGYDPGVRRP